MVWGTNQAEEISSPRQRKCARWGRGQREKRRRHRKSQRHRIRKRKSLERQMQREPEPDARVGGNVKKRDRERMFGDTLGKGQCLGVSGTRMEAETSRWQVWVGRGQRCENGLARSCVAECSRPAHRLRGPRSVMTPPVLLSLPQLA